jgi:hypothetical protein
MTLFPVNLAKLFGVPPSGGGCRISWKPPEGETPNGWPVFALD